MGKYCISCGQPLVAETWEAALYNQRTGRPRRLRRWVHCPRYRIGGREYHTHFWQLRHHVLGLWL